MKSFKIISLGAVCFVVVFVIAILVVSSLGGVIGDQQERNHNRFVQNVDGLTNTFREPIENCAIMAVEQNDNDCIMAVDEEYRVQFGSLIKLFGYESHIQELYIYWQADLQYWYDSKKAKLEHSEDPDLLEEELKRISKTRESSVIARTQPDFASKVESSR